MKQRKQPTGATDQNHGIKPEKTENNPSQAYKEPDYRKREGDSLHISTHAGGRPPRPGEHYAAGMPPAGQPARRRPGNQPEPAGQAPENARRRPGNPLPSLLGAALAPLAGGQRVSSQAYTTGNGGRWPETRRTVPGSGAEGNRVNRRLRARQPASRPNRQPIRPRNLPASAARRPRPTLHEHRTSRRIVHSYTASNCPCDDYSAYRPQPPMLPSRCFLRVQSTDLPCR